MQQPLKKIVVIGPESTGKSSLCGQLAAHYQTIWCREYARQYLLAQGTNYTFDDLLTIAKGQLALEDAAVQQMMAAAKDLEDYRKQTINPSTTSEIDRTFTTNPEPLLFLDTDMYVMKVWCEFVFGQCHSFILNEIVTRPYTLYLLCKPDLPWVKDELREYPDLESREKLYHIYKDLLINQATPWVEISGNYQERLLKAVAAVDTLL